MIDLELFKKILTDKQKGYIDENDSITKELLQLFQNNGNITKISSLFKTIPDHLKGQPVYKTEITCIDCNISFNKKLTNSYLKAYISFLRGKSKYYLCCDEYRCKKCANKKYIKEQKEFKKEESTLLKQAIDNTNYYISSYLNPEKIWEKKFPQRDRIKIILYSNINTEKVAISIQKLNYYDFLETPYWKAIAQHIKYKSEYKCKLCNSNIDLIAHHNNYDRHGYEHIYWKEDLICICNDCHQKQHSKGKDHERK